MLGIGSLGTTARALATVGSVLLEALAFYLGYGALTRAVRSPVFDAIEGD